MRKIFIAAVLSVFSVSANAALVDHGTFITDTDSGLNWLDMSFTVGRSYSQVSAMVIGGSLDGWRFATSAEFEQLLVNANGGPYVGYYSESQLFSMTNLIGLLGSTYTAVDGETSPPDVFTSLVGYVDSTGRADSSGRDTAHARQIGYSDTEGFIRPDGSNAWDFSFYFANPEVGSLLVQAVPVPASVWLFGSGLGLLGWMRRRKTA